jgi:hypothetical protein
MNRRKKRFKNRKRQNLTMNEIAEIVIYVTSVENDPCFTNGNMARDAVERCILGDSK